MNNNFKRIMLLLLIIACTLILTGCNNREDVKHTSKEKMISYINSVLYEPVEFVNIIGQESDTTVTYYFMLTKRNIEFSVKSSITAPSIDGSRFGNYKESLLIDYESAIMFDKRYISARQDIAKKMGIIETLNGSSYKYFNETIHDYNDLPNLAKFYIELDKLYSFNESKPQEVSHDNTGSIKSKILGSIESINFSYNRATRLQYDNVYNDIEKRYVGHLKWFNLYDPTVPENVWNKYKASP